MAAERAFAAAARLRARPVADSARASARKYEEAAGHWRAAGDSAAEANALKGLGDALQLTGRPQEVLRAYERALAASVAGGERRVQAEVLAAVCHVHNSLGDNRSALDECTKALELGRAGGSARAEADALDGLGGVYYSRGDLQKALDYHSQALTLWRGMGDSRGQARSLMSLGYAHAVLKEVSKAFGYYTQAIALWRAAGDHRGQIKTLTAMGFLNSNIGETQESLNLYFEAMRLAKSLECPDLEGPLLSGMGYAYNELGEKRKSLFYYARALAGYKSLGDRWGEAAVRLTAGMVHYSLGEHELALNNYREALAVYRALGMSRPVSHVLREIGLIYDNRGSYDQALKYYRESLELTQPEKDPREAAYTLAYVGRINERAGDARAALGHYERALSLNRSSGDRLGEALTLYSLARALHGMGDSVAARAHIEEALKISETLRSKLASDDLRASYFASVYQQFELYTDVLMSLHGKLPAGGLDVAAFEASERARARSLLEILSGGRTAIRQGADEALLRSERDLRQRIGVKSERRIQLLASKAAPEQLAAVEAELESLTAEHQQVQGQIKAASPRYAALVQPPTLTLAEIQSKVLDADTVLLEYLLGGERSFVWVVTPDSFKHFTLPPRAQVERAAQRVYELLTERNRIVKGETGARHSARLAEAEAAYGEAADSLSRMLLGPVAQELGSKRVVIVADGALQYIPFAALPDPAAAAQSAGAERPPLVVGHEVLSLPSASVLALMREELRGRARASKAMAVIADPVFDADDERLRIAPAAAGVIPRAGRGALAARARPVTKQGLDPAAQKALRSFNEEDGGDGFGRLLFSRREAMAIMGLVPREEALLALDFDASLATVTSGDLANYRVIHFATHGLLNGKYPELSGIILSLLDEKGRPRRGFLQLNEIYNLNLPCDLVVLSACQTALGKEVKGEGLVGLTRGFMYAGAARVIASLWKVDDAATAELMAAFYRAMLDEGATPAAALRSAQVHMWRQGRWRSPYYWAAFTLQGEWR